MRLFCASSMRRKDKQTEKQAPVLNGQVPAAYVTVLYCRFCGFWTYHAGRRSAENGAFLPCACGCPCPSAEQTAGTGRKAYIGDSGQWSFSCRMPDCCGKYKNCYCSAEPSRTSGAPDNRKNVRPGQNLSGPLSVRMCLNYMGIIVRNRAMSWGT